MILLLFITCCDAPPNIHLMDSLQPNKTMKNHKEKEGKERVIQIIRKRKNRKCAAQIIIDVYIFPSSSSSVVVVLVVAVVVVVVDAFIVSDMIAVFVISITGIRIIMANGSVAFALFAKCNLKWLRFISLYITT